MIKRFQCGFYQSICIEGDQVYIGDLTGSSVQHYDAGKQEFAATLEAGFDTTIRTAVSGDDVYVCNKNGTLPAQIRTDNIPVFQYTGLNKIRISPVKSRNFLICNKNGIYRARKDGGSFTKVLEAGTYHFANDSAVLLKFFVMGDAFYVVYGEDGASIKKYYPAGEDEAADKTINIYSLKTNEVILDMISEFQNMYPDTEIVYETGEGAEGSITTADRKEYLLSVSPSAPQALDLNLQEFPCLCRNQKTSHPSKEYPVHPPKEALHLMHGFGRR